ncbi:MAG: hypothetical protein AAF850_09935 [Pseudomonadota bacterium]
MAKHQQSTQELYLRLGSTPRTRSVRADRLFRKLRGDQSALDAAAAMASELKAADMAKEAGVKAREAPAEKAVVKQ